MRMHEMNIFDVLLPLEKCGEDYISTQICAVFYPSALSLKCPYGRRRKWIKLPVEYDLGKTRSAQQRHASCSAGSYFRDPDL